VDTEEKYEKFRYGRQKWLNFQSERMLDDPSSYWHKIKDNRCLLAVNGFFEHREVIHQEEKIKTFKTKPPEVKIVNVERSIPYYIEIIDQPMFFIPALYSIAHIKNRDGFTQTHWTFSFGTREGNSVMKQIHNSGEFKERMPLMVPFELSQLWLKKGLTRGDVKAIFDYEMPSEKLRYHTVRSVRARKEPTPDELKLEQFTWDNVPELSLQ
jgi:putative SOS response-associated peptidase YedK